MGVGTPEDLIEGIERGIDMFDCVHPTRIARHGAFWDAQGRQSIKNEKYKFDESPLMEFCECFTCKYHSKSYIRHLLHEEEMLGFRLLSIHNLHFLINFIKQIRFAINENRFSKFKQDFYNRFKI
jgi:queuine tRNA-ribosyltransferase